MAPGPPLVLSRDPALVDAVRRLAEVAGAVPDVVPSPSQARRWWGAACLVVVGSDLAAAVGDAALTRRAGVVVVSASRPDPGLWRSALALGAAEVLELPADEGTLLQLLVSGPATGARALVLGCVGGCGGAGASTLAVALAVVAARRGIATALVDADPGGGGLDLALGAEDEPGARWPDLAGVTGVVAAGTLTEALPRVHGVHLLSTARDGDRGLPDDAVPAVIDSLAAAVDLVVLDLPRVRFEQHLAARCDVGLLVATPDVRGTAAAMTMATALRGSCDLRLVVRHVPGGGVDPDQLAQWLGLPVAAELSHDPRLVASVDAGEPPGRSARSRLSRTCAGLLDDLVVT